LASQSPTFIYLLLAATGSKMNLIHQIKTKKAQARMVLYTNRVRCPNAQCDAAQASDSPVLSVDVSSVPLEHTSGAGAVDPDAGPSPGQQRRQCLV
jgi:hypothetical protein